MIDIGARVLSPNNHKIEFVVGCLRLRHNSTLLDLLCLILEDTLSAERISGYTLIDSLVIQRVHSHRQVISAVLQESSTGTSIEG